MQVTACVHTCCRVKEKDLMHVVHCILFCGIYLLLQTKVGDTGTRGCDLVVNLQHQQHTAVPLSVIGQLVWRQASHKKQSRFSVDPAGEESQLMSLTQLTPQPRVTRSLAAPIHVKSYITLSSN